MRVCLILNDTTKCQMDDSLCGGRVVVTLHGSVCILSDSIYYRNEITLS